MVLAPSTPELPVIVIVACARLAREVVTVRVELVVALAGENDALARDGRPVAVRLTAAANPLAGVIVTV